MYKVNSNFAQRALPYVSKERFRDITENEYEDSIVYIRKWNRKILDKYRCNPEVLPRANRKIFDLNINSLNKVLIDSEKDIETDKMYKKRFVIVGDVHNSLLQLLIPLILSKVIVRNKKFDPLDYVGNHLYINYEINKEYNSETEVIYLGDLVHFGYHDCEFEMMDFLVNVINHNNKVHWLIGNHDIVYFKQHDILNDKHDKKYDRIHNFVKYKSKLAMIRTVGKTDIIFTHRLIFNSDLYFADILEKEQKILEDENLDAGVREITNDRIRILNTVIGYIKTLSLNTTDTNTDKVNSLNKLWKFILATNCSDYGILKSSLFERHLYDYAKGPRTVFVKCINVVGHDTILSQKNPKDNFDYLHIDPIVDNRKSLEDYSKMLVKASLDYKFISDVYKRQNNKVIFCDLSAVTYDIIPEFKETCNIFTLSDNLLSYNIYQSETIQFNLESMTSKVFKGNVEISNFKLVDNKLVENGRQPKSDQQKKKFGSVSLKSKKRSRYSRK